MSIMNTTQTSIESVVRSHLCTGCGACAGLYPDLYRMEDRPQTGRRPVRIAGKSNPDAERGAVAVCPGAGAGQRPAPASHSSGGGFTPEWGTILEIWEGHAADADLRWRGSSGGVVTALAAFAVDSGHAAGAVHVRQSPRDALANEAVVSRSRDEIAAAAGSRYAPASPCERLADVAAGTGPMVFIGKPCDVQAAAVAAQRQPALSRNLGLTISIFCAGTPSSNGTRALLAALGVPEGAKVTGIRYRGDGWPGEMAASWLDETGAEKTSRSISYEQGWGGILQTHRQWRCHVCADHTGEFADLSVGDPWDRPRGAETSEGSSLIVVRTARGRDLLYAAMAAGAVVASRRAPDAVALAQPNLARSRRILFGRLMGLRIIGLAAPRYAGWQLGSLWLRHTGLRDKLSSVAGTLRRAWRRRLWRAEGSTGGRQT